MPAKMAIIHETTNPVHQPLRNLPPREFQPGLDLNVIRASIYLKDAVHARPCFENLKSKRDLSLYSFFHSGGYHFFYVVIVLAHMMMAVWERPSTFYNDVKLDIHPSITQGIDLLCCFMYSLDIAMQATLFGKSFFVDKWLKVKCVVVPLMVINSFVNMSGVYIGFHRFFRAFMFIEHFKNIRRIAESVMQTVPKILNVVVLIVFHLLFFGVFAYLLFKGVDGTHCNFGSQDDLCSPPFVNSTTAGCPICSVFAKNCLDYFRTLWAGILRLFVLLTTANYPDVMMPAVDCSYWSAIFFILYLLIGLYFLLSLVMAVACSHFQEETQKRLQERLLRRRQALEACFNQLVTRRGKTQGRIQAMHSDTVANPSEVHVAAEALRRRVTSKMTEMTGRVIGRRTRKEALDLLGDCERQLKQETDTLSNRLQAIRDGVSHHDDVFIDMTDWKVLMQEFRPKMKDWLAELLFHALDRRGLNRKDFLQVCSFVETKIHKQRSDLSESSNLFGQIRWTVTRIMTNQWSRGVFDALVTINAAFLILQFSVHTKHQRDSIFSLSAIIFLIIFSVEVILKIFGQGFYLFWTDSGFNKLDFVAVGGSLVAKILELCFNLDEDVGQAFLVFRLLRLLRMLRALRQFTLFFRTVMDVISPVLRYLGVLFALFYFFSLLGMECFAGQIEKHHAAVLPTSYGLSGYWKNNFDTIYSGLITLFELMVVNNWVITLEGHVAAVGNWAHIFFFLFYFFAVIVIMNVLVAFLIDAYDTYKPLHESKARFEVPKSEMWKDHLKACAKRLGHDWEMWNIVRPSHVGDIWEVMYWDTCHSDSDFGPQVETLADVPDRPAEDRPPSNAARPLSMRH